MEVPTSVFKILCNYMCEVGTMNSTWLETNLSPKSTTLRPMLCTLGAQQMAAAEWTYE